MMINRNGTTDSASLSSTFTGTVRSVNEKGLRLEGHDAWAAREKARKRALYLQNRERLLAKQAAYRATLSAAETRAYMQEYAQKNADRLRAQRRAYYQKNRERAIARARAWQAQRADERRAYMQAYYETNRQRLAAQTAQYKRDNKEAVSFRTRQRVIAKGEAPVNDLTRPQWIALKQAYGQRCAYCSKQVERLTQDHVIPLSRRGSHTARNIVPACRPCNARKFTGPSLPLTVLPCWADLVLIFGETR